MKELADISSRLDTIPTFDRQTDSRADGIAIPIIITLGLVSNS